jgi:PAS domain-containing protein
MPTPDQKSLSTSILRWQAQLRLDGHGTPAEADKGACAALSVLHELASAPETAADALALLHELQVHQVELDLQAEELRTSRAELEAALNRHIQLYDCAPVSCFTVDRHTRLFEVNLTGAQQLGVDREALLGQTLDSFLRPGSASALHKLLADLDQGRQGTVTCDIVLKTEKRADKPVYTAAHTVLHAAVNIDPNGSSHYLIAFMAVMPI